MSEARQCILKYGEKALQIYKKSLGRSHPDSQEQVSVQLAPKLKINQKGPPTISPIKKRLVLDPTKGSRNKLVQGKVDLKQNYYRSGNTPYQSHNSSIHTKKDSTLGRSKSRTMLLQPQMASPKATFRKSASKDKRPSLSTAQLQPFRPGSSCTNKGVPKDFIQLKKSAETKIKHSLEISDLHTFFQQVVSSLQLLINSEFQHGLTKCLKLFCKSFQRLYYVSEDYIYKCAESTKKIQSISNSYQTLARQIDALKQTHAEAQRQSQHTINDLTKKVQKLQQREKVLMNTFQLLKNSKDSNQEVTQNKKYGGSPSKQASHHKDRQKFSHKQSKSVLQYDGSDFAGQSQFESPTDQQ